MSADSPHRTLAKTRGNGHRISTFSVQAPMDVP